MVALVHGAVQGIKSQVGAALFVLRCRIDLAIGSDDDANATENLILLRDNLLDIWGEPSREDALYCLSWLGREWLLCATAYERETAQSKMFIRRAECAREMWQRYRGNLIATGLIEHQGEERSNRER